MAEAARESLTPELAVPGLTWVFRLDGDFAGAPLEIGDLSHGHRRIVVLAGGTVSGPRVNGKLLPGVDADWQLVGQDGTTLLDIRYAFQTNDGALVFVQSRGLRTGDAARGFAFRTGTQIETASPDLNWLNRGLFISVGGLRPGGIVWDVYLVE
jgi:hypothetical protein